MDERRLRDIISEELFQFFKSKHFTLFYGNLVRAKIEEMVKEQQEKEEIKEEIDETSLYDQPTTEKEMVIEDVVEDDGYDHTKVDLNEYCPECNSKSYRVAKRICGKCGTTVNIKRRRGME